jgi:hypothetical protein
MGSQVGYSYSNTSCFSCIKLILFYLSGSIVTGCGGGTNFIQSDPLVVESDLFGRVITTNKLSIISCPRSATAVFVAGQSNAANHSQNSLETISENVLQFSEGKCYVAKSPVLDGTGTLNNPFQAAMIDYQKTSRRRNYL